MSAGEICWRLRAKARDSVDRCLAPARRRLPPVGRIAVGNGRATSVNAQAVDPGWPEPGALVCDDSPLIKGWRSRLVAKADKILQNKITLFDLEDHDLGRSIDWNYEYKARIKTPMRPSCQIDYRDTRETGDCKFAWEPSRHHHLVTLGRAYRMTGDTKYAESVVERIESWSAQCPFDVGMQWRSPLELAIRLINWVFAAELIRPSGVLTSTRMELLLGLVYRHAWEISRKYSRYSSANNHTIGEAAGVYLATAYFTGLRKADPWRREARSILIAEIERQTYADGGNREQAMGYHLFVLEFLLLAALAGRRIGDDFPETYWAHLERMFGFLNGLQEGGEHLPMYGDCDDGFVLDLGGRLGSGRDVLPIGACLFDRADFKRTASVCSEPAFWLLGTEAPAQFEQIENDAGNDTLESRAFPDTGIYLLQRGGRNTAERVSLTMDIGELGYGPIAAHGHADALGITLRVGGCDVLVDPGTYDYFTYPVWRDYFRSTRAHNTIEIDGIDQSEMLGPFLWGERAEATCEQWTPSNEGGFVRGAHTGYGRLNSPVTHRRSVELAGSPSVIRVVDELRGEGRHEAVFCLHFAEELEVEIDDGGRIEVSLPAARVEIELDPAWSLGSHRGSENPPAGWVSRGYHRKVEAVSIFGRADFTDGLDSTMTIRIHPAAH